ncbi:MAG: ECF transporter S component [Clostridia bacterium]|nr:ECF transporter S component [Clostridia bacterium]
MSKKKNLFTLCLLALLTAIMLVMDFTPLGYITTGLFSITLMTLPVAIGAACLGEYAGLYLGFLFGLTSFLQCFGIGAMIDPSAAVLFATSPFGTIFACFIPRMIAGYVSGLLFRLLYKKFNTGILPHAVACAVVPLLNTVLFLSAYVLMFKNTVLAGVSVKVVFLSALSINGLIELAVTLIIGTAVSKAIHRYLKRF